MVVLPLEAVVLSLGPALLPVGSTGTIYNGTAAALPGQAAERYYHWHHQYYLCEQWHYQWGTGVASQRPKTVVPLAVALYHVGVLGCTKHAWWYYCQEGRYYHGGAALPLGWPVPPLGSGTTGEVPLGVPVCPPEAQKTAVSIAVALNPCPATRGTKCSGITAG